MIYYFLYELLYVHFKDKDWYLVKALNVFQYITFRTAYATITALLISLFFGGKLIEAKVEGSSGHPVLDTQALEMVKRVAALPAPPEGLREREFAVLVPVVFRLER